MAKKSRTLTFTDETWELMQKEAEQTGVSISALISVTMTNHIQGKQALGEMGKLKEMIDKLQGGNK